MTLLDEELKVLHELLMRSNGFTPGMLDAFDRIEACLRHSSFEHFELKQRVDLIEKQLLAHLK